MLEQLKPYHNKLNFSTQHQQIALTLLSGIGSKRARIIASYFKDLTTFFEEKKLDLSKLPGVTAEMIKSKQRRLALERADEVLEYLEKIGANTLFLTDTDYPKKLKQCDDAPILLYSKGNVDWTARKTVAIVGTRAMTNYGKLLTEELVDRLSSAGAVIVSGMAYGIDICSHKRAIANNAETWGVLGHGLDQLYPAVHRKIAERMFETGGLISEFIPGTKIEPGNFPMRNRIVAGLCDATVVVESGVTGGSMITANLARDYNREVFAFPGDIGKQSSSGCLKLIRENIAALVQNGGDVLESLDWKFDRKIESKQAKLFENLSRQEEYIIDALQQKQQLNIDSIGFLTKLPLQDIAAHLLQLEFKGIIRSLPGRRYALV